jgi:sigma-B regulation protein RsbU (phosphoserine phosphatase)
MIRGKSGFVPVRNLVNDKKSWMYYTPLSSSGWTLGVVFPEDELMADINHLSRALVALAVIGLLLLLIVVILIAGSITKPLRLLVGTTQQIATGNLDVELPPVKYKDEVGKLTESFDHMRTSLQAYIWNLTDTTAAKERIESELKIAHDIQMGILPKMFPPFPEKKELDIHATLLPAKEVGGDFYDFFFIDDDHLCFTIGDVSGKGVPASLFMAVTSTLIKAKSAKDMTPAQIIQSVNVDLCAESDSNMFVTAFLGILNIRTGKIEYSNGGHNIPYIIRKDGKVEILENTASLALGVMGSFQYQNKAAMLEAGDGIYLYTDGVTEAMDFKDELYSEEKLEKMLKEAYSQPSKGIVQKTVDEVQNHSQGVPQSDDITVVMLRYLGIHV